eukprot:scaffold3444_cov57-Phaeocystis_antarctica.AAC.4
MCSKRQTQKSQCTGSSVRMSTGPRQPGGHLPARHPPHTKAPPRPVDLAHLRRVNRAKGVRVGFRHPPNRAPCPRRRAVPDQPCSQARPGRHLVRVRARGGVRARFRWGSESGLGLRPG